MRFKFAYSLAVSLFIFGTLPFNLLKAMEAATEQLEAESEKGREDNDLCTLCKKEKCTEPRIYKSSLEFEYKDFISEIIDKWHEAKQEELRHKLHLLTKKYLNKNFALLGLAITYEHEGKIHITKIHDIENIFSSGTFLKDENILTVDKFFKLTSEKENELQDELKQKIQDHLLPYFNHPSSHLATKVQEKKTDTLSAPNKPGFAQDFFHSEQAILLYLVKYKEEFIGKICSEIPAGSTIHILNVNIVSDRQMCRICGATCLMWAENPKEFERELITIFKEKGYIILINGIKLLVEVSGLRPFQLPNKKEIEKQRIDSEILLDAENTEGHVIQMDITNPKKRELNKEVQSETEKQPEIEPKESKEPEHKKRRSENKEGGPPSSEDKPQSKKENQNDK